MSTLIITEKPNVAERIAKSIGNPKKERRNGIVYYRVGDVYIAPTVGHIYTLREKNGGLWRYPVFDVEWVPSYKVNKDSAFTKNYLENLKFLGKKCNTFINACDYDIEGEVIGYNIIKYACNSDPLSNNVLRMKYSTLTKKSILNSYRNPEKINKGMVDAGLTRHILDWYWGINLSRALTLAIRRAKGYTTLSVGRVQGPTLKILATRDREISAFKPEPYWELEMLAHKGKKRISAMHIEERFWDKERAENSRNNCGNEAIVIKTIRRKVKQKPPFPFDLTTLQTEAYRIFRINPGDTLKIAQELYTNAYISYPRTSSQQLPGDINYREIIQKLSIIYKKESELLLSKERLVPNNGKKKDPAHPAIHPTGEIPKNLTGNKKKIYDLVCRRFLATFGDDAIRESTKIEFDNNNEIFVAKGVITIELGWQMIYGKYAKFKEEEIPDFKKGDKVEVDKIILHEKETQPPKRYTPSSIIREMEKRNLGTKATRSQIIDILFKRGYLKGKSIEVTPLGLSVVDTLEKYCPEVLSEKLTRKFEIEMERIEAGEIDKEKVLEEGRNTILRITKNFKSKEDKIGLSLAKSLKSITHSDTLGKCLKCEGNLILRKSKYGGYFIGCDNYPKCRFKISIPRGGIRRSGKCNSCGYAVLTLTTAKRPFSFCINPECPTKKKK